MSLSLDPMNNFSEQFKINLNQNLWGLVIAFVTLGLAEYFQLCTLYWFALSVSVMMVISVAFTTTAYTRDYWRQKSRQDKGAK